MRHKLSISIILASVLALTFITVDAQQGQGGGQDAEPDGQAGGDGQQGDVQFNLQRVSYILAMRLNISVVVLL